MTQGKKTLIAIVGSLALLVGAYYALMSTPLGWRAIGAVLMVAEKVQEPKFKQDRLPLALPVALDKVGVVKSSEFEVKDGGRFLAYLAFDVPDFEKSQEKARRYDELSDVLLKFNDTTDLSRNDPKWAKTFDKTIASNESWQFTLSLENVETGQIVQSYKTHFVGNLNNQHLIAKRSYVSHYEAFHISPVSPLAGAGADNFYFEVPKGRYRLIFDNHNASTAYTPFKSRILFTKPLPNWH